MRKLSQWNRFLGAHFPWFVLSCAATGILFPDVFSRLNSIMVGLFAFMTFANSLGGGFRELGRVFLRPLPVIVTMILLHVVIPLVTLGLGNLLFPNDPLFTTGLVLEYVIPTGVASLMWVGMCGGNSSLCLSIVLLDTLAAPVVIPLSLKLLVGSVVEVDTWSMMGDLLVMVALPALAAMTLYQATGGRVAVTLKPRLEFFAKVTLLVIITANATSCSSFLHHINGTLVLVMVTVFFICLLGFFLGYWAAKLMGLDFPNRETICLNTGLRNISAGSVIAMQYFPAEAIFPVAFSPLFLQFTTSLVVKAVMRTPSGKAYFTEKERASTQ